MLEAMVSRGPDGSGLHADRRVTLGHRRLVLLDEAQGSQPFHNEDGSITVIFNGEIYNHRELRSGLLSRGHRIDGYCDGNVIAHLYEESGTECFRLLEGMFSIAIYDRRGDIVVLARDRTGEKPLYYAASDGGFVFASSATALLKGSGRPLELDPAGIAEYFALSQSGPIRSVISGVMKVPAAHYLVLSTSGSSVLKPYWRLDYDKKLAIGYEDAVVHLEDLLEKVVAASMDSDFEPAVTLSGGVDSSVVFEMMVRGTDRRIECFSLSSSQPDDPEFVRACEAAARHGLHPQRFFVSGTQFQDMIEAMRPFDEPVSVYDSVYLLQHSQEISKTHRVVLTGNGADEAFGGYEGYLQYLRDGKLRPDARVDLFQTSKEIFSAQLRGDRNAFLPARCQFFGRCRVYRKHSCSHALSSECGKGIGCQALLRLVPRNVAFRIPFGYGRHGA